MRHLNIEHLLRRRLDHLHPGGTPTATGQGQGHRGLRFGPAVHDRTVDLDLPSLFEFDAKPLEGPFGAFLYLQAPSTRQVWVAGGIGITPFLSMARDLDRNERKNFDIELYYSVRNVTEAAFLEELQDIERDATRLG